MNRPMQNAEGHNIGRFAQATRFLSELDADTTASLISAAADLVLVIDEGGVIRDAAFGSEELLSHGYPQWVGKTWAQTVTKDSRPKVDAMLRDLGNGKGARWRHLNHATQDGSELPLSYSVVAVPPANSPSTDKSNGRPLALAFGRDLRPQAALQQKLVAAQASMERDFWRLRHAETRYRLLFQVTSEALLIMDSGTEKLEEGNPAAHSLFGENMVRTGWSMAESLTPASYASVRQLFSGLRSSGRANPLKVHFSDGRPSMTLSVSMFRQEETSHFLLRFTHMESNVGNAAGNSRQLLADVMESAPDAFVVTDMAGTILTANRAFLQLAQVSNEALVCGESLERWLGRAGVDLSVLISNLRQRDVVRLFATRMKGDYGSVADVEISAVAVTSGEQKCLGFTIREIGLRLGSEAKPSKELPRSTDEMTELVGRVPLKDIVRETTDLIEQLCIQAALNLTGDNRASAAEMLGLSRQSLYVKLRRFGMGDLAGESED